MRTRTLVSAAAVAACLLAAGPASRPGTLGELVAEYCRAHLDEQVGNGECSVLAWKALGDVGAKRRGKDAPEKGDYTWGELALVAEAAGEKGPKFSAGKPRDVRVGDVVQYRDVKLVHHAGKRTGTASYHHHTSVVSGVDEGGMVVHVLQQNVNGKKVVMPGTVRLADLSQGWLRFYHPVTKKGADEEGAEPPPEPKE